jgi:hypothetical protein
MRILKRFRKQKPASLEERVKSIEILLAGDDKEPTDSNWSYEQIRQILDRTDLVPDMNNQELRNIAPSYERIEKLLDDLGTSPDFYTGHTLKERLNVIEGCISILHSAHLGHTNFEDSEFQEMHGFTPFKIKGDILERINGMQKKLDLIQSIIGNVDVTISGKTALQILSNK